MSHTVDHDLDELEELRSAVLRALHDGVAITRRCWEDPSAWRQPWDVVVRLELPGLLAPQAVGGSGAPVSALVTVLEASGKSLAPTPLRSTAANVVPVLMRTLDTRAQDALVQILATGSACAWADVPDGDGASAVDLPVVAEASHSEFILVRLGDEVIVVRSEECRIISSATSADPSVPISQVEIPASLTRNRFVVSCIEEALGISRLGAAAELVGVATLGLEWAVDHSVKRVQFDKPIGTFQSIKHRLADTFVAIERARGLVQRSAFLLDHGDQSGGAVSHLAYAAAAEAAVDAARTNIRLHGAMGATWELDAHLVLRRTRHIVQLFGSPGEHYRLGAFKMDRCPV
jgi:alkylation response protein AidB-like acyl-CoA dehydrogenase